MIFGKEINRYYLRYAWMLLLGIFALFLVDYFQLKVPEIYRTVINGISDGTVEGVPFDAAFLVEGVVAPMLRIILIVMVGRFVWRVCLFGAGIRMETDLRHRMFDRARYLSQNYYHQNKVGHLMSLFTNDLETVQDCFGSGVLMAVDAILQGGMALYKMFRMHVFLTLFALIPLSLLLIASGIVGSYMMRKWEARQQAYSDLADAAQESFSGLSVIKAFVKEAVELSRFHRLNRDNEEANVTFTRASVWLDNVITLCIESVMCVIIGYGGFLVHRGDMNAGQIIEYIGYFSATVWPVMAVSQLIDMGARGRASLKRISGELEAVPEICDAPGITEGAPLSGEIEFRHLTFRYPRGEFDALSDVSFTVRAGERVGIVGKTGAGKTTLADLLLRVWEVPRGTVFLDGRDVNDLPLASLRRQISYVPQDHFLFGGTVFSNIGFACDDPTPEDVERVARLADVHGNIEEFPDKYQTVLGERGVTVSGGQNQRISIARALLKDASILILDDAVSAVDTATERHILDNLAARQQPQTLLMVAHRISTVEGLDKIVYLEEGRVAAVGTHAELCATCDNYRRMVDLQKLEEEKAGDINA